MTATTTFILWRYFRRSKRIIVYINLLLATSIQTVFYIAHSILWNHATNTFLQNAEHVVDHWKDFYNNITQAELRNGWVYQRDVQQECNTNYDQVPNTPVGIYRSCYNWSASCVNTSSFDKAADDAGCPAFRRDWNLMHYSCIALDTFENYFWLVSLLGNMDIIS